MTGITVVGVVFVGLVALALVLLLTGRSSRRVGDAQLSSVSVTVLQRARHRGLLCVGFALTLLVAGAALNAAAPGLLGLPLALAPGLAAAGALLGYAMLPVTVESPPGPTSASVVRRTAWSYGSRRAFAVPGILTLATLGFLVWAALVADPDDRGLMRSIAFTDGPVGSSAGPFPGSFYGIPLALVTILLAMSAYVGLRRISETPTLPTALDAAADRRWRTASTSLVTLVTSAALLGYLGGAAIYAGRAARSAAVTIALNGGHIAGVALAGTWLALAGVALVLTGVVAAALAVGRAFTLSTVSTPQPAAPLVTSDRR